MEGGSRETFLEMYKKYGNKAIDTTKMEEFGDRENFLEIYKGFYRDLFTDPLMNVLFDWSNKETNVPAEVHGTRLGLFFLNEFGGDKAYSKLRGNDSTELIETAHTRAK